MDLYFFPFFFLFFSFLLFFSLSLSLSLSRAHFPLLYLFCVCEVLTLIIFLQSLSSLLSSLFISTCTSSIRVFVASFTHGSLVPYMESVIQQLNAHVEKTRKGISRSLMSISKKFFGGSGSKTASPMASPHRGSSDASGGLSTEACMRKSADCAFMLQDYDQAQAMYHSAKRDFNNDRAWMQLAGVQVRL